MPGLDRTGPRGEGPRTGWAMGKCRPRSEAKGKNKDRDPSREGELPEEDNGGGFGRGPGRGPGRGFGRGFGRGPGRGLGRGGGQRWRGGGR